MPIIKKVLLDGAAVSVRFGSVVIMEAKGLIFPHDGSLPCSSELNLGLSPKGSQFDEVIK